MAGNSAACNAVPASCAAAHPAVGGCAPPAPAFNITGTWKGVAGTRLIVITIDQTLSNNKLVGWHRSLQCGTLSEQTMFTKVEFNYDDAIGVHTLILDDAQTGFSIIAWAVSNTQIVGTGNGSFLGSNASTCIGVGVRPDSQVILVRK